MGTWASCPSSARRAPGGPPHPPALRPRKASLTPLSPSPELHRLEPGGAEAGVGPGRARHRGHPAALQAHQRLTRDPQGRSLFPKHGEDADLQARPALPAVLSPRGLGCGSSRLGRLLTPWGLHGPLQLTAPLRGNRLGGVKDCRHPADAQGVRSLARAGVQSLGSGCAARCGLPCVGPSKSQAGGWQTGFSGTLGFQDRASLTCFRFVSVFCFEILQKILFRKKGFLGSNEAGGSTILVTPSPE